MNAYNGWGGRVYYGYSAPATWRCAIDTTINCDQVAYRRQLTLKYVYDGSNSGASSNGDWTKTSYGYGEGLYRLYKNDPVDFLGYPTAWSITYHRNSYGSEAKVTEHWFYRNNGYSWRGDIANNPDPRLGRTDYERVLQPGTSGCPSGNQISGRCLMSYSDPTYTAHTGSGTSWGATSSYTVRPRWVRQDQVSTWVDGAENTQKYFYETSKQNSHQYGNVTRVEDWAGGVKRRTTETYYYPNDTTPTSVFIVNKPARVRILNGSGGCEAESRTTYDGNGGTYNAAPTKGNPSRIQQALTSCSSATWIGDSDGAWNITQLGHDSYGNVTTETSFGSPNIVIKTSYDSTYNLFPIRRWNNANGAYEETAKYYGANGLAMTDSKAFWGQIAEWCGVNDVCTRTSYDDFGRPLRQWNGIAEGAAWNQSDASANVQYGYYAHGYSGSYTNFVVEWHAPRCYGNFVRKYYNGLGQLVQEQRPQQDWRTNISSESCTPGNNAAEVDVNYKYDALGNQIWASVPTTTTAGSINRAADWTQGYSRTEYDVLGRVSRTYAPNNERHDYNYVGLITWGGRPRW